MKNSTKKGNSKKKEVRGDERFAAVGYDPRFQRFPKAKSKVKVDDRFKDMFENPEFQVGSTKDKRGRGSHKKQKKKLVDEVRRYYRLDEDEDEDEEKGKVDREIEQAVKPTPLPLSSSSSEEEEEEELDEAGMRWARMRGLAGPSSSSESESESESDDINNDLMDGVLDEDVEHLYQDWGVGAYAANPNENIPLLPEATHRLACVDLDWEHIKAVDILAALRSFVPGTDGDISSVTVYPSDYGLEKMEEEKNTGPQAIWKKSHFDDEEDEDEDSEGGEGDLDTTKLRYYERSKLRWYYAIIVCSTAKAAESIYNECDGMELMKTANVFDLRFVPDDQSFEGRVVRDVATSVPADYSAPVFQTKALQHTNVELTWDKVDDDRKKTLSKKFKDDELKDEDFKTYLASASDESEEEADTVPDDDQEAIRERYRKLVSLTDKDVPSERKGTKEWEKEEDLPDGCVSDKDKELQVTFAQDLESLGAKLAEKAKEKNRKGAETVWEAYLRRRKEKREEAKRKGKVHYHSSDDSESDSDIEEAPPAGHDEDDPTKDPFDDPFFNQNDSFVDTKKKGKKKPQQHLSDSDDDDAQEEQRRAELEMLLMDDTSLHAKKKSSLEKDGSLSKGKMSKRARIKLAKMKKRAEREDGSDNEDLDAQNKEYLNMDDPRFKEVFENPEFALDPTDPRFAKSGKAATKLATEVAKRRSQKRRSKATTDTVEEYDKKIDSKSSDKADIKLMVASLKRKSASTMNSKKKSKPSRW
ncbi:hypothetical protein M9434_003789 [Picochlorum sp. BPE23]|nr:hypothetical protein M9434_003789 [Picochlorum sp. BPE23]